MAEGGKQNKNKSNKGIKVHFFVSYFCFVLLLLLNEIYFLSKQTMGVVPGEDTESVDRFHFASPLQRSAM